MGAAGMSKTIELAKADEWITEAAKHAADELFPRSAATSIRAAMIIEKHMRVAVALARKHS